MSIDLNSLRTFRFIPPGKLIDRELQLVLTDTRPVDVFKGYVPEYIFEMRYTETQEPMGTLNLRVALTDRLKDFGGNIGYEVFPAYRGHRYAGRSCRLLFPLLRALQINPVVFTCDPQNLPSVRTIEGLGARLVAAKNIEIAPKRYRMTNIYHLSM
jgi:tagatose 1,6-diphosphate aldolase